MKKVSGRLANLTPEQREKLLQKLREQKKDTSKENTPEGLSAFRADEQNLQLSYAQQRLWFLEQLVGQQASYNIPAVLRIKGNINSAALEKALQVLINHHESLRTRFIQVDGRAKPLVLSKSEFKLRHIELKESDRNKKEQELSYIAFREAAKTFKLDEDTLFRACLIQIGHKESALIICMHHIISDAWSMRLLVSQLSQSYNAIVKGSEAFLPDASSRYVDFAAWQREQMEKGSFQRQLSYWKQQLQSIEVLNFPIDKARPTQQNFSGKLFRFNISQNLSEKLHKLAKQQNKTLYTVLLSAWQILLYQYTGQKNFAVGTPVANRSHAALEGVIGFFVNTLAIKANIDPDISFVAYMDKMQSQILPAFANQDVPFEKIIDELGLARDMSQSPVFQNLFSFQNDSLEDAFNFYDLEIKLEPIHTQTAKFDLSLDIVDARNGIQAAIEFSTDLFFVESIKRLSKNFEVLLESIVLEPEEIISELNCLSSEEIELQLNQWNNNLSDFPKEDIVTQFQKQVSATPDKTAVVYADESLSYSELNHSANRLANYLIEQGVNPGDYIGICLDRNSDLIVSILAVIKTGAAYLPIDPAYPSERIRLLIKEGELGFLISQDKIFESKLNGKLKNVPLLTIDSDHKWQSSPAQNPEVSIHAEQLLYVIFTSGSTGVPKRTAATHISESNLVDWYHKETATGSGARYLLMSALGFDLGQKNIFTPLLHGDVLVLPDLEIYDPEKLISCIENQKISCLNCAPSAFYPLLENPEKFPQLKSLQHVFLGGETIQVNKLDKWLKQSECSLVNSYGPSECTDIASYYRVDDIENFTHRSIPIGKPSQNVKLFLLDENRSLAPIGAYAELYIGGVGVGPGYLGSETLSNEKFIDNPLPGEQGRLYASGDIVRYLNDGNIEYIGRRDKQIKIRGYRIETSEICAVLLSYDFISDVAVSLKSTQGRDFLAAYVVVRRDTKSEFLLSTDEGSINAQLFRKGLKESLPDFMVPSIFIVLDALPLTPNGKVDYKALPEPDLNQLVESHYLPPKNELERSLQDIWQSTLNIDRIGIHDNFFELGGDSILSIQIVSAARKRNIVLSPAQIFRFPTIAELSQLAATNLKTIEAEQGPIRGTLELSPAQKWFFNNINVDESCDDELAALSHFNQSLKLRLLKSISLTKLKENIGALVFKHDALNISFEKDSGKWQAQHQVELLTPDFLDTIVTEHRLNSTSKEELFQIIEAAQKSLSLTEGRLLHCCLINELKSGKAQQSVYIFIHHLVVDGVSWRILLNDMSLLLNANTESKNSERLMTKINSLAENVLADKTLSFKQWNSGLQGLLQDTFLNSEKNYWLDTLEKIESYTDPIDELSRSKGKYHYKDQAREGFALDKHLSNKFLKQANISFSSDANDLLLCALLTSFGADSRATSLLLDIESHGRELPESLYRQLGMPDVSHTIGWFTNIYPVLLEYSAESTEWASRLKSVKEQLRQVPSKGLGFSVLSHSENDLLRIRKKPSITFNYLGQFSQNTQGNAFRVDTDIRSSIKDQSPALMKNSALDILLFIEDDCLSCDFIYDQTVFTKAAIENYLRDYKYKLKSLIEYCCAQNQVFLTPSDVPAASVTQKQVEKIEQNLSDFCQFPLEHRLNIESMHDLMPTQTGMLFHSIFSGDDAEELRYLEQFCAKVEGELNIDALQAAWQQTIHRHANLRSCFYWHFDKPLQIIFDDFPFEINTSDLSENEQDGSEKVLLDEFLLKDRRKGFQLDQLPLLRVSVVKTEADSQWMVWTFHHILLDGWSVPIVLNEVFESYIAELQSSKLYKASETPTHYGKASPNFEDFIAWYLEYQNMQAIDDNLFWKTQLNGFKGVNSIELEPLAFPIEDKDQAAKDESCQLSLDAKLSDELRKFSKSNKLTLNSVVQAAWSILLSYYSNDDDVVFGSTVSGRPEQFVGVENVVGMFINTLPLRVQLSDRLSLIECLRNIQQTQQEISAHQLSSLVSIQNMLGLGNDSALFNSILVFENFPVNERLKKENSQLLIKDIHSFEKTNYPITISVEPGDTIKFKILFDGKVYRKSSMERLLGHLACLLGNFPGNEESKVFDIPFITCDERKALDSWNQTQTSYPRNASLAELVEQQVKQNPDQLALKFDDIHLSYAELNQKANQLARFLYRHGVEKGDRIALFMDRSEALLVSALAVVKTGAAYVPLDPAYPEERLQYMLSDCEPRYIISVSENESSLYKALGIGSASENENIFFVDQQENKWKQEDASNPDFYHGIQGDDLAYLMYTSGSTGQPKGVCLSHRSIIRLVMNSWYLSLGPRDKIGHICNVCFDASAYEIWGALLNGSSLIGFDRETILSEDLFAQKLQDEGVTNMLMTTSLFHLYSRHRPEIFSKMRCILVGGEPLQPEAARQVLRISKPLHLMNVYGPTENGVLTTVFDTWDLSERAENTPVGKPISNSTVYIVNKRNQEMPVGVVGELVSGGDGVGLGYWNLPDISARSFIKNPFSQQNDARMYRTGDLARRLPDGNFEVLGRIDDQLKIRGFRIEPSEIIKRLNTLESVSDAVVIGVESEGNKKHLVAYIVTNQKVDFDSQTAKHALSESLPAHLVPDFFVEIDSIPITPNGKLDKAKLPRPKFGELFNDNYAAARNDTEAGLVTIWQDVLRLSSVGIYDNFFELGGDSIISIQIVSRAKRAGLNLTPKLLFEYPCIADISKFVSKKNKRVVADQGVISGEVKLSPIQNWFFNQQFENPDHFNQSLVFKVEHFLTIQSITPAVSALLKHHDVLRLRFSELNSEIIQKHDNSLRSLSSLADILSEKNLASEAHPYQSMLAHSQAIQSQLSITEGPLFKIVLYHLGKEGQRIFIVMHHLVTDGVSWRILLDHLNMALQQQLDNKAIDLGEKSTSFQFYSKTLHEFANSGLITEALDYWKGTLSQLDENRVKLKTLTQDNNASLLQARVALEKGPSEALLFKSQRAYRTETQDLLLLAFSLALYKSELIEHVYIELETHGRNCLRGELAEQIDLSNTLGWFTGMYPVLGMFDDQDINNKEYAKLIKTFKTQLRKSAKHGSVFQILKYLHKDKAVRESLKSFPEPQVSFNYLGQISDQSQKDILQSDFEYMSQGFGLIQDNAPENKPIHALSFSASHYASCFHFNFTYDSNLLKTEQIEDLTAHFNQTLIELLDHCLDKQNFGFTPSDLPYIGLNQMQLDQICTQHAQKNIGSLDAIYPLSPMQEGMLFHSRLDADSGMYCEQVSVLFEGELNIKAMEKAWNSAIGSHDVLRTTFVWEDLSQPLQLVQDQTHIDICVMDWRSESNAKQKLYSFLAEDRAKGFDFSSAPLMRLHYILWPSVNPDKVLGRFIWSYHHILLDGWSMPLLMREIFERYNYFQSSSSDQLDRPVLQKSQDYQNYIEWLYRDSSATSCATDTLTKAQQFWKSYLAGFEEANNLAIGVKHGAESEQAQSTLRFKEISSALDEQETEVLLGFAARHQVTVNTLLQAAWALLLSRYSGEQDIVFGITVSGRPSELTNVESIVGLFINTIPFRVHVDAETKLDEWLKMILKNQIQLRQFETTPLVEIQGQSEVDGSRSLFDSILVFENYPLDETLAQSPAGLTVEELDVYEQTNFPLSLIILPGKSLHIKMLFDSYRYELGSIEQVLKHLKTILLDLVSTEDSYQQTIQSIDYLSEQERQTIIEDWNNTYSYYPRDSYLQDIVSEHRSEQKALISKDGSMTYLALEEASAQLANYMCSDALTGNAVKRGDKVVICLNRSNELIVAMLAILKAGAVYVPLDPGYPEERQRYMLEDTQAKLIITDTDNVALVKHLCANKALHSTVSFIDVHAQSDALAQCATQLYKVLPAYLDNEDIPAAILYTSGSTGQPKGVCLTHRGLSRMVLNTNYMQVKEGDRVAHVSNICFDAASFEVWAALLNGLPLVILDKDIMLDLQRFEDSLKKQKVSILLITTALFNVVAKEQVSAFDNIRYLFFGGEASDARMVRRVLNEAKPQHLMHMYGPSENSTYATWYEVKQVAEHAKSIPIGKAVSNSQVYIMNQQGDLLPPGVAGEIVCVGDGLALGYLNKPEQTAKAFVMRSLPGRAKERMYLTGDLGVCLPDGNIEILGRIDNQVKIRGHRIEPEEIIARIKALPQIKKAHVLVKQDKENKKYLLAYYVPEDNWRNEQSDKASRARELKLDLKQGMPDYMVPSFYIEIDELPLTANGKIDSKALPDANYLKAMSEYQAPENELEKQLVAIWEEVLVQEEVGVNDDFFELGGHSLLATQIHSRIRQQLNIDIPLRTLFELPTIREFSEFWQAVSANHDINASDSDDNEEFEEGEL